MALTRQFVTVKLSGEVVSEQRYVFHTIEVNFKPWLEADSKRPGWVTEYIPFPRVHQFTSWVTSWPSWYRDHVLEAAHVLRYGARECDEW